MAFPDHIADVEFDLDIVRRYMFKLFDDEIGGSAGIDRDRGLRESGLERGAIEPNGRGRAFVFIEKQAVAAVLDVEDMAQQESLERRDVGNRDRRLDHGWGKIIGHGNRPPGERGAGGTRPGALFIRSGFTPFAAFL